MNLIAIWCIADVFLNIIAMGIIAYLSGIDLIDGVDLLSNPTPAEIYRQSEYNWFGALFMWLLFIVGLNIYVVVYYIIFGIYWLFKGIHNLFTVGRK